MATGGNPERLHIALVRASSRNSGGGFDYEANLVRLLERIRTELDVMISHWFFDPELGIREQHPSRAGVSDCNGRSRAGLINRVRAKIPLGRGKTIDDTLEQKGVSLVYFASPNRAALSVKRIPIVTTLWDLGHRDLPHFPEFRGKTWMNRENYFRETLTRSHHVFTDSAVTGQKIEKLFGVNENRWSPLGLLVSPRSTGAGPLDTLGSDLSKGYVIYPAKRWPHKNHLALLEAFRKVVNDIPEAKLVLTGDQGGGAQDAICDRIQLLELDQNVVDFGYVDENTLSKLVANSSAVLMPSKLGPTNIPPLMALALGVPAIVSNAHFFEPKVQGRLEVVHTDTAEEWAEKISARLKYKGKQTPFVIDTEPSVALVRGVIQRFDLERKNWPKAFG